MTNARDDLGCVGFDLHASAPAEALLAAPKLAVEAGQIDRDAGRQSGQGGHKTLAMRLAGGFETQHGIEFTSYPSGSARGNPKLSQA